LAHLAKKKRCEDKSENSVNGNDPRPPLNAITTGVSPTLSQDQVGGGRKMNKRTKQDGTAFSCECGSFFNQKCNFYRHRKTCLRVLNHGVNSANDEMNELRKELTNMREEMQKIKNAPSSSTTNSNNSITINNNIQINGLGKEDVSGISEHMLDTCIRRTSLGLIELVKNIHFDNACNRNVRAKMDNKEYIEYHNGDEWNYDVKGPVLKTIVDNGHRMMSEHFDDHTDRLKKHMSHAMFDYACDWLRKMEKHNISAYTEVMEKVFVLIVNQSNHLGLVKT
jgi:hypothetical protein